MFTPSSNRDQDASRSRLVRKSQLSTNWKWLVERMHELWYGEIEVLAFAKGEPIIDPPPRFRPHRKLTGPRRRPRVAPAGDFVLKEQVVNLHDELTDLGSGIVALLVVRDGLPCEMKLG